MEKLRARFPHVLVLAFEPEGAAADSRSYRARVTGRDDLTVAAEFVAHVRNSPATAGERVLLASAFEAARLADAAEPRADADSGGPPGPPDEGRAGPGDTA